MRLNILTFSLLMLVVQSAFAVATSSTLCRQFKGNNIQGEACLHIPLNWDKRDIVYYLHGTGENAKGWEHNPYFRQVMSLMERQNLHRPLVVTISFGSWWLLKDFGNQLHPSLLKAYLQIQKEIEAEIFKGKEPRTRTLVGDSMGGFNSLLILAKTDLHFDKAVVLCPGFAVIGPYSTQEEIQGYLTRNRPFVNDKLVFRILDLLKMEFPTPELWQIHAPFNVVKDLKSKADTHYYVMGNTQDEYGFGEGARLLQAELTKMNLHVTYEVVPGHHCVMNPESLVSFLK